MHQKFVFLKIRKWCNKVHGNVRIFILGVHTFAPLPALYGEVGLITVTYINYLNTFRFWNRMMKQSNTSITRHILIYQ